MDWVDIFSKAFFSIFSVFGLIGLATLGLYIVAVKIRATPLSWGLAFGLGLAAAYAAEFSAEIGLMMAFNIIPFQPWSVFAYATIAFACIWLSGHTKASSWPISIPCAVIAAIALQHGIRTEDNASIYAGISTAILGVLCWFIVPKEFSSEVETTS